MLTENYMFNVLEVTPDLDKFKKSRENLTFLIF